MICFSSSSKPTSKIRSASSMIRHCRFLNMNPGVFWKHKHLSFLIFYTNIDQVFSTGPRISVEMFWSRTSPSGPAHLEVVQQAARCGHQDVDTVGQFLALSWAVAAAHDQAVGVHMVRHQLLQNAIGLHGQLARGWEDDYTGACEEEEEEMSYSLCLQSDTLLRSSAAPKAGNTEEEEWINSSLTISGHELEFVDELYARDEEGQRLTAPRLCCSQNIPAEKQTDKVSSNSNQVKMCTKMWVWHIAYTAVTYLPSSRGRILLCWISVMCSKPNSFTPFSVFSLTSPARETKDVSSNAPERSTVRESVHSHKQIQERWR